MRKAFPSAETHIYEAGHAFANEMRPTYVEAAETSARRRAIDFLARRHRAA